jgi:hypothetical protein
MSSQHDPIKQNIMDWCQQDGIRCVEAPANPQMVWGLIIHSQVTIYKITQHPDRIYFQSSINLAQVHRTLVNQTWDNNQRNMMMFNMKKLVGQLNVLLNFIHNNEELVTFHTYKIHCHETISKADFLEKYLRIQAVHEIMLNQLNIELGIALASSQNTGNVDTGR